MSNARPCKQATCRNATQVASYQVSGSLRAGLAGWVGWAMAHPLFAVP